MHTGTQTGRFLALVFLGGLLLASCNLYPKAEGYSLVLQIQAHQSGEESSGRFLAADAGKVLVELWQSGIRRYIAMADVPPPAVTGGGSSVSVEVPGVTEGLYEVRAYGVDSQGLLIQSAKASLDFKLSGEVRMVTLKLAPNEEIPGLVTPMTAAIPAAPVSLSPKATAFAKLVVPGSTALPLWTDSGTEFKITYQRADGTEEKELLAQGSTVAQGKLVSPGTYYLYYYYNGSSPVSSYSFYVDTYDKAGKPVDRRSLIGKMKTAVDLLDETVNNVGSSPGQFPADASWETEKAALTGSVQKAAALLPPNYVLETVDALAPQETELTAAITALEGKRVPFAIKVTGVMLDRTAISLNVGSTDKLIAAVTPSDATNQGVTWASSNSLIVEVDPATGDINALNKGTATITVTTDDGKFQGSCEVTVTVPVTGVTLNTSTLNLVKGTTGVLTATVNPMNATNRGVTWSTDNPSVATVDSAGKVTAVGGGTAAITVTTAEGNKTAVSTVTVTVPVTSVTLNTSTLSLVKGTTGVLTATVNPLDATNQGITWSTDNPSVATVDSAGMVAAVGGGTAVITVTTAEGNKTAVSTVTVTVPVTSVTLNTSTLSLVKGTAGNLTANVAPADATDKAVTWNSDTPTVASVDSSGKVTALAGGTAIITATTADGPAATCTVTVTVPVTGVTLNTSTLSLVKGTTGNLTANVAPADATDKVVTWNSDTPTVASVDSSGKVTALASGTATITATTADGPAATCTVTVTPNTGTVQAAITLTNPSIPTLTVNLVSWDLNTPITTVKTGSLSYTVNTADGTVVQNWWLDGVSLGKTDNPLTLGPTELSPLTLGNHTVTLIFTAADGKTYTANFTFQLQEAP